MAAKKEKKEDPFPLSDDDDIMEETRMSLDLEPDAKEAFALYSGPKLKARHARFLDFALKDCWPLYGSTFADSDPDDGDDDSIKNAVLMYLELDPRKCNTYGIQFEIEPLGNGYLKLQFVSPDGSPLKGYRFIVPTAELVLSRLMHHWQASPTPDTSGSVDNAIRNVYFEFRLLVPPGILCRILLPSIVVTFDRPAALRFARVRIVHDSLVHAFGKNYSTPGIYLPSEYGVKAYGRHRAVKAHAKYYKTLKKCCAEDRQRLSLDEPGLYDPFKESDTKMPDIVKRHMNCCPEVSDEMTKLFDHDVGGTPEEYEVAIRAVVAASSFVYRPDGQFDTSSVLADLLPHRREYKKLTEPDEGNEERPLVSRKVASAQRRNPRLRPAMRAHLTCHNYTVRHTRMDATRAHAGNATAMPRMLLQNIPEFDATGNAAGRRFLPKKTTKVNVGGSNDTEKDGLTDAHSTTTKGRPDGDVAGSQAGVRLQPGTSSDDLRAQLADSKAENEELKQQMELLKACHTSELRAAEENLNCIVEQIHEQTRKQQKELTEQLSSKEATKDNEIAGLKEKTKQQSDRLQAYYERKNELERENADLNTEVAELRRQNEVQSQQLTSMAKEAKDAQGTFEQMLRDSGELLTTKDELEEKVTSLETNCTSLESDLSETRAEKDALKETAEKLGIEVGLLKGNLEQKEEELFAERTQMAAATEKETAAIEEIVAGITKRDELVAEIKQLKETIKQLEKAVKDKKQRDRVTKKDVHAAAGSQVTAQQKPAAARASSRRSKQNASQSTSQAASAPQFQVPAAKADEASANSAKRSAMQPIAHSTPLVNMISSPRESKRTKDSVKASATAPLKTNALVPQVTPRACTSLLAATSDNKENAENSPIAEMSRANTVPRELAAAPKKQSEPASKVAPKPNTRARL